MNLIKYLYLNYTIKREIKKDEDSLLEKGLKKVRENGLELCFCQNSSCSECKGKEIHLPSYQGKIDLTNLVSIVVDNYPEIAERYLANKEKLSRLIIRSSSKI